MKMMLDKKDVIDQFNDLLNAEIQQCIDQDIDFAALESYERILIIQSCSTNILKEAIGNIYRINKTAELIIFGKSIDKELADICSGKGVCIIKHEGGFRADDLKMLEDINLQYQPDAVLYFNDYVNSLDYGNVENLMTFFEKKIPVYSYSFVQSELNRHKKVIYHYRAGLLFKSLVDWFSVWDS